MNVTSTFDSTAATFDRYRALPAGAPESISAAVWETIGKKPPASVLDVGAGTGRIGKAFVAVGDPYVGLDLSFNMLREFRVAGNAPCLIQADAQYLPLESGSYDGVVLMQVLSGASNGKVRLSEVCRVLSPGGVVVVGHTVAPRDGVDSQLKRRLTAILREMGIAAHESKKAREQALAWLESSAARHRHLVAASWTAERTPQEFITRHRTGARFAALPPAVQEEAMQKLSGWAQDAFGSLDAIHKEQHNFELDIFEF